MTRRSRKAKRSQEDEEDSMASRLELELGKLSNPLRSRLVHVISEYESRARKDKSEGKIDPNYFRSIHFNDWLAVIMQVCALLFALI